MRYLILCLLLTVSQVHGTIIETMHFKELTSYVDTNTVVVLDIDDTLLVTKQMLGCDEWFMLRCKQHEATGLNASDALVKALCEWEAIRKLTEMEIVEPGTDEIVRSLQDQGIAVIALTSQGMTLASRTTHQLKKHLFDLTRTAPSDQDHYFSIKGKGILYHRGILFTAGSNKGESLFTLFEKIGYIPKKIVFVDDKLSQVKDIEIAAKSRGVEYIGLRYAFSDSRKKRFEPALAHHQFMHSGFHKLLSDEEAKTHMATLNQTKRRNFYSFIAANTP